MGLANKAWWGTQSQPNLCKVEKQRKPYGKNSTPKRDEKNVLKAKFESPRGKSTDTRMQEGENIAQYCSRI